MLARYQSFLVHRSALTAPAGASPATIAFTWRTVSSA